MTKRRKARIALDIALAVTLVFEMLYMHVENFPHELAAATSSMQRA